MSVLQFQSEATKIKSYQLVHDPTLLFHLLFIKYGDIEDDYNISYANQLIYNLRCHFNTIYKEHLHNSYSEFIETVYILKQIKAKIIKLNEYYKNYLKFFSKPMFINPFYNKIINDYYDKEAEIFYIKNYSQRKNSKEIKNDKNKKCNKYDILESSLSSFDNDTENDIIFNKRIKNIIDNNLDSKSLTITLDINTQNDLNYIKKHNISNSLENIVDNLIKSDIIPKNIGIIDKNLNIENKDNQNGKIISDYKVKKDNDFKTLKDKSDAKLSKKNMVFKSYEKSDTKSKSSDKLKEKYATNININFNNNRNINIKKNKECNILAVPKEEINKFNFQLKNKKIQSVSNNKKNNNNRNYELEKIQNNTKEIINLNFINKNNFNHNILPIYNIQDHKIKENINNKKILSKKNLSIGLNLNAFSRPKTKIQNIKFYSPQNCDKNKNKFNKLINFISYKNSINYSKNLLNKDQSFPSTSDILINSGKTKNPESKGQNIYNNNKKYKILTRNRNKNSLQKINSINLKKSNINIFNRKVFQLPSSQSKKNKSSENIDDDCSNFNINGSNHNLSKEKIFRNTGNYFIGNSLKKENKIYNLYNNALLNQLNSPSVSYKDNIIFNSDINLNQKFENKNINILKKIIENNYKSQNNKNRNFQDINKAKDNNINIKRIFNPINFKKSFNKKNVSKNKEIKLGQNLI